MAIWDKHLCCVSFHIWYTKGLKCSFRACIAKEIKTHLEYLTSSEFLRVCCSTIWSKFPLKVRLPIDRHQFNHYTDLKGIQFNVSLSGVHSQQGKYTRNNCIAILIDQSPLKNFNFLHNTKPLISQEESIKYLQWGKMYHLWWSSGSIQRANRSTELRYW